jgi:hypothetical protein
MKSKSFFLGAALLFFFTVSNAQKTGSASFNGAWRSVDNKGFSVLHDGYFNSVEQDSTGNWNSVHAGTYTVNGDNTITFKVLYSSYPEHVGSLNTAEYTMKGDTVKMRHFKKLIDAQGRDITDQMPTDVWVTAVRLK